MEAARDYAGALIRRVPRVPLSPALPCASNRLAFRGLIFPCAPLVPYPAPLILLLPAFSSAPQPRAHTHPPHWCPSLPAAPAGRAQSRPAPPHPLAAGRRYQVWLLRGARASADQVTAGEWLHLWPLLQSRAQKRVRSQEPGSKLPRCEGTGLLGVLEIATGAGRGRGPGLAPPGSAGSGLRGEAPTVQRSRQAPDIYGITD
ncbi:CIDEA isoform 2 [Pongo abelii]|uniref:CIDEA isoform 2 n=1 Tax=Pongo abelii TaxID=9601 RepID=A0A2J8R0X2_PONAB|nr:CIDEA isoform 2 [Pongo abelii]